MKKTEEKLRKKRRLKRRMKSKELKIRKKLKMKESIVRIVDIRKRFLISRIKNLFRRGERNRRELIRRDILKTEETL